MQHNNYTESLVIPACNVHLEGDLSLPAAARGLVVFVHGSGSGRKSERNRFVARYLGEQGFGTLLFDLLTGKEEIQDALDAHLRFNITLLADRLVDVTEWIAGYLTNKALPTGYFGASTGAAAALEAAVKRPQNIRAIVSRGGRPDLAAEALPRVNVPTLLIVGGADTIVLRLNRDALDQIHAPKHLAVVPEATHLFEEPGALEEVARLAADWFARHLSVPASESMAESENSI